MERYNSYNASDESAKIVGNFTENNYSFDDNVSITVLKDENGVISQISVYTSAFGDNSVEEMNIELFYDVSARVLSGIGSTSPAIDMPSTLGSDTTYVGEYKCYFMKNFNISFTSLTFICEKI